MTSLKREKNGDWFARKGIPQDIRGAYRAAYGKSQEERFRRDSGLSSGRAKREFLDWLAEIEDRIDRIRNVNSVQTLSHRHMHALIGCWYAEFTQPRDESLQTVEVIEHIYEAYEQVVETGHSGLGDPDESDEGEERRPKHAARVRAFVAAHSDIDAFLIAEGIKLSEAQRCDLVDTLEADFVAALAVLKRRSLGYFEEDTRLVKFPDAAELPRAARKENVAGWNAWQAFEAWVAERKPAESTVNRWRGVFQSLDAAHDGKDVALYTADDAVNWKNSLITDGRGTRTVNEIWLSAARRVFGWVKAQKKISDNPFEGVKVAGPSKPPKTRQDEFTEAEIKVILNGSLGTKSSRISEQLRAAYRWVPWICAYTGARAGEITQLRKQDFQRHRDGFWFIRITPESGTVKGGQYREVVLHEHLLEQGLIDFVEKSADGHLFCKPAAADPKDPMNPPRPPHVVARNKVGDWVRSQGVDDPRIQPNHAWRHTFKRRAARAGIEQRLRDGICGHSSGNVGAIYETPFLEDIAEAIGRFPRYDV